MEGDLRVNAAIDLPSSRMERVRQDASGPFLRVHQVDQASLIHIPAPHREAARGCFGAPQSHRSLLSFGTTIFVPAHVSVHIHSAGFASRHMIVLRFSDEKLTNLAPYDDQDSQMLMRCADIRERRIIETINRMSQELDRDAPGRDMILQGLSQVALGELARYLDTGLSRSSPNKGMLADWQMRQIAGRLRDEYLPPPSVTDLAALCGLGRRHFMRAFKARIGLTAMEWVERSTFERATRMLEEQRIPIKEVSARLGYNHPGSFASAFSRRFGLSPREWRSRNAIRH